MHIGMIGLGRMGSSMARRLMRAGDSAVVFDRAAAANEEGVPAPVLAAALFERFASRGADAFSAKVLSAMRLGFGGHVEKT